MREATNVMSVAATPRFHSLHATIVVMPLVGIMDVAALLTTTGRSCVHEPSFVKKCNYVSSQFLLSPVVPVMLRFGYPIIYLPYAPNR